MYNYTKHLDHRQNVHQKKEIYGAQIEQLWIIINLNM